MDPVRLSSAERRAALRPRSQPWWRDLPGDVHYTNTLPAERARPEFPREPGSYLLLFTWARPLKLQVGRLGPAVLAPGLWVYGGSAWGPGGLQARLRRHLYPADRRPHWHVDRLTSLQRPHGVVWALQPPAEGRPRLECIWIRHLLTHLGFTAPVRGFGSGDCRQGCPAHLVHLPGSGPGLPTPGWMA